MQARLPPLFVPTFNLLTLPSSANSLLPPRPLHNPATRPRPLPPQTLRLSPTPHRPPKPLGAGNPNVLVCERGTMFGYSDLIVDPRNFVEMRDAGCPVTADITHALQQVGRKSGGVVGVGVGAGGGGVRVGVLLFWKGGKLLFGGLGLRGREVMSECNESGTWCWISGWLWVGGDTLCVAGPSRAVPCVPPGTSPRMPCHTPSSPPPPLPPPSQRAVPWREAVWPVVASGT